MRQAETVVSQRQLQLLFHPRQFLGKRGRLAGQPPIVLAPGQVIPLHKARVDRRAGGGCGQSRLKRVRASPDPLTGHLDHPSFFTLLNHLGIQQIRRGAAPWGGIPSSLPLAFGLIPLPIGMQQGGGIARPWVAGKEGDTLISHQHHAIQPQAARVVGDDAAPRLDAPVVLSRPSGHGCAPRLGSRPVPPRRRSLPSPPPGSAGCS